MNSEIKTPLLSIGIPTYNRSSILKELLATLSPVIIELQGEVEILISDNASTDETANIVDSFISKNSYIRFHSSPENLGFDANVNNVMKLSSGNYVWLLGDDDYVREDAIKYILSVIKNHPDTAYILMNYSSRFSEDHSIPSNLKLDNEINIFNHNELFLNIKTCSSLLSANIYKRSLWNFEKAASYIGSGYIHLLMIPGSVFSRKSLVLKRVLVEQRSSDDSLLINTGSSGAENEVNFEHHAINNSLVYPNVFWSFDINVKLRRILMHDLREHKFEERVISKIDHATQIETLRQSIYLKKSVKKYTFKELLSLIFLSFVEYKKKFIFWFLILPILMAPKKMLQLIIFIFDIFKIKPKLADFS